MNPVDKEKTLMLIAGTKTRNSIKILSGKKTKGFTLIELTVVIFLAGLLLSITVPVVRDALLHDNLKTAARKLVATITWLRNESISKYRDNILMFNIDDGRYWEEAAGMDEAELLTAREEARTLPEDVRIIDIDYYGSEKKVEGETGIKFSRKGYVGYTLIHLGDKSDRKFTIVIEPFLGKVKIMEDYLDFEDIKSEDN